VSFIRQVQGFVSLPGEWIWSRLFSRAKFNFPDLCSTSRTKGGKSLQTTCLRGPRRRATVEELLALSERARKGAAWQPWLVRSLFAGAGRGDLVRVRPTGLALQPDRIYGAGIGCRSRMLVEQQYLQEEDGHAGSEREKKDVAPGEKRQLIHAMSSADLELSAMPRSISSPFSFQTHNPVALTTQSPHSIRHRSGGA